MEPYSHSTPPPERKRSFVGLATIVFVAIFLVLVLLLGRTMVEHRFFRGGRVHQNGSIGQ